VIKGIGRSNDGRSDIISFSVVPNWNIGPLLGFLSLI
jgi:hypothetical protein